MLTHTGTIGNKCCKSGRSELHHLACLQEFQAWVEPFNYSSLQERKI